MSFKNFTLSHCVPSTVYADFESYVISIAPSTGKKTVNVAHHIPASFCYVIVDWTGKPVNELVLCRGEDVVDTLLRMLLDDVKRLNRDFNVPTNMTAYDERRFQNATHCHLCKTPITGEKVRNHSHVTGEYLGAAHNACNINFKARHHVPVSSTI